MIQLLSAAVSLVFAYLVPGLSISFAVFPYDKQLPRLDRIVLSVGLSVGIVTLSMFLSNYLFGHFAFPVIVGFITLLAIASWIICWRQRSARNESIGDVQRMGGVRPTNSEDTPLPRPFVWLFILATAFIVLFRFYHALLFPITNWDSLTEFAYLGRSYFVEGRITAVSGATLGIGASANYPPLIPLLYAWFYLMTGNVQEVFAQAVSPIFSVLTVIVTYQLAKRMYRSKTLAISSLFFLVTAPIFIFMAEECLSEAAVTFYSLATMYFLYLALEKRDQPSTKFMFLAGLLTGIAAFIKYPGLMMLAVGWIVIGVTKIRDSNLPSLRSRVKELVTCRSWMVFTVGFIVFGAPWYLRNLIVVGNPVYPFLYKIFGGKGIDAWVMQNSWDAHFSTVTVRNGFDLSFPSLILTYYNAFFRVSPYELLDMGPFIGVFLAIGAFFMIRKRSRADVFLLTWACTYFVLWRFTFGTFLRYLVVALPAFAILSARGLASMYTAIDRSSKGLIVHNPFPRVPRRVWMKIVIFLILFEGFLLPCAINGVRGYKTWTFINPSATKEDYLRIRFQGTWDAVEFLNNQTPTNAVILTYDHSLPYNVDRPFVFSDEVRAKDLHLATTDTEILTILESLDVTYIVETTTNEEYFPLLDASYFYQHLGNGNYAQLVLDSFPAKVYTVLLH